MSERYTSAEIEWAVDEACGGMYARCGEFCIASDNCTCHEDAKKIEAMLRSLPTQVSGG